jgi:hypothetical protein
LRVGSGEKVSCSGVVSGKNDQIRHGLPQRVDLAHCTAHLLLAAHAGQLTGGQQVSVVGEIAYQ